MSISLTEQWGPRVMNSNGRKRSSSKTQGSSRHDAWRRRLLCIYQFCTVKFFEHMRMRQNTSQQRNFWLKRDWNVRDLRMIICPRRQFLTRKILIRLKTNKCLSEKLTEIYEKQAKRMRHCTYTISCLQHRWQTCNKVRHNDRLRVRHDDDRSATWPMTEARKKGRD